MSGKLIKPEAEGRKFYEGDIPRIVSALESIAKELKRANDFKEAERASKEGSVKDITREFIKGEQP